MPISKEILSAGLRTIRERLGLSQSEMALQLGVTSQSIYRYESGRPPKALILLKYFPMARTANLGAEADMIAEAAADETGVPIASVYRSQGLPGETISEGWVSRVAAELSDSDQKLIESAAGTFRTGGIKAQVLRKYIGSFIDQLEAEGWTETPALLASRPATEAPSAPMPTAQPPESNLEPVVGPVMPTNADGIRLYFDGLDMQSTAALADIIAARIAERLQATQEKPKHGAMNLVEFPEELTPEEAAELAEVRQIMRAPSSREEKSAAQSLKVALNARRKAQQKAPGEGEKHRRHKAV